MFFTCIVCHKIKKEKTKWVRHKSQLRYDSKHSYIHMSCLEEVLQNPENYSLEIMDDCVHIGCTLRDQMQKREQLRKELLHKTETLNLEIFLDKAKGKDIGDGSTN